jgi:hypothetical protein
MSFLHFTSLHTSFMSSSEPFLLTGLFAGGATSRVGTATQEIWQRLETLERGAGKIQRKWSGVFVVIFPHSGRCKRILYLSFAGTQKTVHRYFQIIIFSQLNENSATLMVSVIQQMSIICIKVPDLISAYTTL